MVAFGFGELRLDRIWARCEAENVASYRVLEKVGMRREERLREEDERDHRRAEQDELPRVPLRHGVVEDTVPARR